MTTQPPSTRVTADTPERQPAAAARALPRGLIEFLAILGETPREAFDALGDNRLTPRDGGRRLRGLDHNPANDNGQPVPPADCSPRESSPAMRECGGGALERVSLRRTS